MKHILAILIIIVSCVTSQGQSFEGKITYKVEFEINEVMFMENTITKDLILNKMKEEGVFHDEIIIYIQEGNYIKEDNSVIRKRIIYKSNENLIYLFEKDSEYVTIMPGENINSLNSNFGPPALISTPDSTKVIQNDTCKLVKLSWGNLGEELYWYSTKQLSINSDFFKNHNYDFLNEVLGITHAYPMEISKSFGAYNMIMTIDKIEEIELDENLFQIPELKQSNKKHHKPMGQISGNKIMKIKN